MLVLRRKIGETLLIDQNIEVTVLEIEGDRVKIGIKAPTNVKVVRQELLEEIARENLSAAALDAGETLATLQEITGAESEIQLLSSTIKKPGQHKEKELVKAEHGERGINK